MKQWKQVERLGQPLVNEVLIPRTLKDYWNTQTPDKDKQFEKYYTAPGLIKALNARVFGPVLDAALGCGAACPVAQETGRADLSAILLRGFDFGPGAVDLTFGKTGSDKKPVDELRLNTKTQPVGTSSAAADRRGLLCNFQTPTTGPLGPTLHALDIPPCSPAQFDGYPNGRRLGDDVTDIQIAAIAGLPINGLIPPASSAPTACSPWASAPTPRTQASSCCARAPTVCSTTTSRSRTRSRTRLCRTPATPDRLTTPPAGSDAGRRDPISHRLHRSPPIP